MTALIAIFHELLCTEAISPVSLCFRPPECRIATDRLRVARASSWGWRTAIAWSRQPSASGETLDGGFCECAFSVSIPAFTRAPVRGISVAPRHSVFCFATRPAGFGSFPNKFAQTAQNAEQISFGSLRKSRPSALGSRAHSRGFAMCAPSQFGSSKRRNRHVSEQNHAHRFPWQ
jgi:hypothetical protein